MKYKKVFYSIIVIILTIYSVSIILDLRIDTSKQYTSSIKKDYFEEDILFIESPMNIHEDEDIEEDLSEEIQDNEEETEDDAVEKEKPNIEPAKEETEDPSYVDGIGRSVDIKRASQNLMSKKDIIYSKFEYYREYDKETQDFFISQLQEGIKRAKLDQFDDRLSQERTIETINVNKIEDKLSSKDKRDLDKIIDKLGPINGLKLMKIFNNGITPKEQQDMQELLKGKLTDEEIILLNDILGRYMDK
ncbi:hypothetical protein GOQ27_05365 [Clostridium sp. D2Q-11]|uniref:Uncharacterized protein n=1 Tax=Anaeromonas frigoriresistens TaxID=2683708 RepID=A0A942UUT1_9FIRM|nr:hypothetical protein [Anaeromonas frigoriresistens]MBS4537880.1 hypothetical protein [Anaeromonas frigoriresistens]